MSPPEILPSPAVTPVTAATVPDIHHQPRRGTGWMLASLTCFTGNALLLKLLASSRHVDPWMALTFRAVIGLVVTFLLFAPRGTLRLGRSFQSWLLASRGVLGALGTAAYYMTIGPLGAGKSTLIGNTWCVFAAIMAAFVLKEKLGPLKIAGILLALAGLALLTGMAPGTLAQFGRYESIGLVGALLAAAVVVVIRQLIRTESTATIFASQCVYTLLLAAPIAWWHFAPLNAGDVLLLSAAALCATFGQLAMTEGFRYLPVAVGGAFQNAVPVLITACSIAFFAEPFTTVQAAGALFILWGSFQTVLGDRLQLVAKPWMGEGNIAFCPQSALNSTHNMAGTFQRWRRYFSAMKMKS